MKALDIEEYLTFQNLDFFFKAESKDLPWWSCGWDFALGGRGCGFDPWLGGWDPSCFVAKKPKRGTEVILKKLQ